MPKKTSAPSAAPINNLIVPLAIIVKNGRILLSKRNDPDRPEYHKKWEFPGGGLEVGESIEENLIRETREETGYKIKPLEQLRPIYIIQQKYKTLAYFVCLIPYLCKFVGGKEKLSDIEVIETRWVELNKTDKLDFMGKNRTIYKKFLPELKQLIKKYNL